MERRADAGIKGGDRARGEKTAQQRALESIDLGDQAGDTSRPNAARDQGLRWPWGPRLP